LISNSYDADATEVIVQTPMGQYLATKSGGIIASKGCEIIVEDNGTGMTPQEVQDYFLFVGKERRNDEKRGDVSSKFGRKVMGRKGIGKLAPFGICGVIEVISAGGEKIKRNQEEGYLTAHIILEKKEIMKHTDEDYKPSVCYSDNTLSDRSYTKIILRDFEYRKIGKIEDLSRQLAQRFGIKSENWKIQLIDTDKTDDAPDKSVIVGAFEIDTLGSTKIIFEGPRPTTVCNNSSPYSVKYPAGTTTSETLTCGFEYEGKFYPIQGWIGYSSTPYKDDLMSGIRIYCRGKFASQTNIFNRKAGFTGEHSVRSYLVGEIHADWLDEDEDLIQTDRRDILWSHELGTVFQKWGQDVVEYIGRLTRDPMRKSMAEQFFEKANVEEVVKEKFPKESQSHIREEAKNIAKMLGKSLRGDELEDPDAINDLLQLSLVLAPIRTLDEELRRAADTDIPPLRVVNTILKSAKLAELVTLGRQIEQRLKIIKKLKNLKDTPELEEKELQNLIKEAPWLINPQWRLITANRWLKTFAEEFQKYFQKRNEQTCFISFDKENVRPDFIFFEQNNKVQIVEIKRPNHGIENNEFERIQTYIDQFLEFFADAGNKVICEAVSEGFHITLICDNISLNGVHKTAYEKYIADATITYINWSSFWARTECSHQEFLDTYEDFE
jgi:hypothetical protein